MSKTEDMVKEPSGTLTGLCTRETGPRDRDMVMACTFMQMVISTRGTGKRGAGMAKGSTSTRTRGLNTKVGIVFGKLFCNGEWNQ